MFTCQGAIAAIENQEKKLTGFTKVLDDLETAPMITKVIIDSLRHTYNGNTPSIPETLEEASQSEVSWKIKQI